MSNPQPALGRLHVPDERDKNFLMAAPQTGRRSRFWARLHGGVNDQGATPHCVAHAMELWARLLPVVNAYKDGLRIDKRTLYNESKKHDGYPGVDGTTLRAAYKVLQARGLVRSYTWAWDLDRIDKHLLEVGPVVVGTLWTTRMFTPVWHKGEAFLYPDGQNEGGHAWTLVGINLDRRGPSGEEGCYRMENSWGEGWGDNGRAWVTRDVMSYLLAEAGEAGAAIENRVR